MKLTWLIFIGLLQASAAQAQRLQGAYHTVEKEQGFSSNLFQFVGNSFFYQHSGCLGTYTGEGTFEVKKGKLLLVFRKSPADTVRRVELATHSAAGPPGLIVQVTDGQGQGLPGAAVASQLTPNVGAYTDATGTANLSYSPLPYDKLLVKFVGYDPVSAPIAPAANQKIVVRLGPPYYFAAGDTLTFQLKRRTAAMLVLRQVFDLADDSTYSTRYEHCRRIPAAAAKKQLARSR